MSFGGDSLTSNDRLKLGGDFWGLGERLRLTLTVDERFLRADDDTVRGDGGRFSDFGMLDTFRFKLGRI